MAVSLMGPATGLTNSKLAMADATAERVVKGDTFYAGDKNIKIGTMPNRALSPQAGGQADTYLNDQFKNVGVSTDPTASYWLCENGDGVKRFCIRPPYGAYALGSDTSVLGTTDGYCGFPASKLGNAFNYNVLSGVKYSSENGINTTGSMPNNGSVNATLDPGKSMKINWGYHDGTGTITARSITSNDIINGVYEIGLHEIIGKTVQVEGNTKYSLGGRRCVGISYVNVNSGSDGTIRFCTIADGGYSIQMGATASIFVTVRLMCVR